MSIPNALMDLFMSTVVELADTTIGREPPGTNILLAKQVWVRYFEVSILFVVCTFVKLVLAL